jgi:FtsH-binding integral membrane protein
VAEARPVGVREVLLVGLAVVLVVAAAAVVTALLPPSAQAVVFQTPLLILVLIAGTGLVLWRILRRPSS